MKHLTYVVFILVASMIFTNIPFTVLADSQLELLLRITNQARDNIKISLSQITNTPSEITELYNYGSSETDALAQSVAEENTISSRQHFLSAMQSFKEASEKISSLTSITIEDQLSQTDTSRLQAKINILENTAKRLKVIAIKNNVIIDFTEFDKLIQTAKQNLETENIDKINETLETAKEFVIDAYKSLSTAAREKTTDRARDYVTKQIERFDKMISHGENLNLLQNSTLSEARVQLNKTTDNVKFENIKEMLYQLKQLVSSGNIEEALQLVKSIEETLDSKNMPIELVMSVPSNKTLTENGTKNNTKNNN